MEYAQSSFCPGKWDAQTDHLISAWRPNLTIMKKKKKRTGRIVDFVVSADHRVKLKESEKKDKYLDLARGLKKLWNMKMTIIPIVIGVLGTVIKGLIQGLEDWEIRERVETIQTTALLRSARILRRVWRLEETCYCGVPTEGQGQRAKLCCCLVSDSIIRLFYFTHVG